MRILVPAFLTTLNTVSAQHSNSLLENYDPTSPQPSGVRGGRRLQDDAPPVIECVPVGDAPFTYTTFSSIRYSGTINFRDSSIVAAIEESFAKSYNNIGTCSQPNAFRRVEFASIIATEQCQFGNATDTTDFLIRAQLLCNSCASAYSPFESAVLYTPKGDFTNTTSRSNVNQNECSCDGPDRAIVKNELNDIFRETLIEKGLPVISTIVFTRTDQLSVDADCVPPGQQDACFTDSAVCLSQNATELSFDPTPLPTKSPTTKRPTKRPTKKPTKSPTATPSASPTAVPSLLGFPSASPTAGPNIVEITNTNMIVVNQNDAKSITTYCVVAQVNTVQVVSSKGRVVTCITNIAGSKIRFNEGTKIYWPQATCGRGDTGEPNFCGFAGRPSDDDFPIIPPTGAPSEIPTDAPSAAPTDTPTTGAPVKITLPPSIEPSGAPSPAPTDFPTDVPSDFPTLFPVPPPASYFTPAPSDVFVPASYPSPAPSDAFASPTDGPNIVEITNTNMIVVNQNDAKSITTYCVVAQVNTVQVVSSKGRVVTCITNIAGSKIRFNEGTKIYWPQATCGRGDTGEPNFCGFAGRPSDDDFPIIPPTGAPSEIPTDAPSAAPTDTPTTGAPVKITLPPSIEPSGAPSPAPTDFPTDVPSDFPTLFPVPPPASYFTPAPSDVFVPASYPSPAPSDAFVPASYPTAAPIGAPTATPTAVGTTVPIGAPTTTGAPTAVPAAVPTAANTPTQTPAQTATRR